MTEEQPRQRKKRTWDEAPPPGAALAGQTSAPAGLSAAQMQAAIAVAQKINAQKASVPQAAQLQATASAAAAAIAAQIGVTAAPKAAAPAGVAPAPEKCELEVGINDCAMEARSTLVRGQLHKDVMSQTGVSITCKGRYISPEEAVLVKDRPLFLHLEAPNPQSLERAVTMVERVKKPAGAGEEETAEIVVGNLGTALLPAALIAQLSGPDGSYLKHIEHETGISLRLVGHGTMERPQEQLTLAMHGPWVADMARARQLARSLMNTIITQHAPRVPMQVMQPMQPMYHPPPQHTSVFAQQPPASVFAQQPPASVFAQQPHAAPQQCSIFAQPAAAVPTPYGAPHVLPHGQVLPVPNRRSRSRHRSRSRSRRRSRSRSRRRSYSRSYSRSTSRSRSRSPPKRGFTEGAPAPRRRSFDEKAAPSAKSEAKPAASRAASTLRGQQMGTISCPNIGMDWEAKFSAKSKAAAAAREAAVAAAKEVATEEPPEEASRNADGEETHAGAAAAGLAEPGLVDY